MPDIAKINTISVPSGGGWTYGSQIDASGGTETVLTLASGLSSGIIQFDVFYYDLSTDSENAVPILQLGDSGGFETAGYECSANIASTGENFTEGFSMGPTSIYDAADEFTGTMRLTRWDTSEHLWFYEGWGCEDGVTGGPRVSVGRKTLSGELTQIRFTTVAGTAKFDSGEIRVRYL